VIEQQRREQHHQVIDGKAEDTHWQRVIFIDT
jgi:hypothetical protein